METLKKLMTIVLVSMMFIHQTTAVLAGKEDGSAEKTALSENAEAENEDAEAYLVSFITDEHASIDVFYTQDYTSPDQVNVTSTLARSSSEGTVDISGDGQVNFRVNLDPGYELAAVTADKNYKNLKDASATGIESIYRLTKVTGPVVITIQTKEKQADLGTNKDIVINEIESNGDMTDWVEIYNKGAYPVDISGWYVTDDDNTRLAKNKTFPLKAGTILAPGEYYVFDQKIDFDFGLGAPDEVNLYDGSQNLVEKYSWSTHANGVYARIPDGTGNWMEVSFSTKGCSNGTDTGLVPSFPNALPWPGSDQVITYDENRTMFKTDSSGLDFYQGQLYCINNKQGTFWVMDVNKDGSMEYANGFTASGKNLAFMADALNPSISNPDAEGITVDGMGNAYAAVERDNNNKDVNYNVILKFDPWTKADVVAASQEWNITSLLPDVPANAGIEAVEWVPNEAVDGKLFDINTGELFDHHHYPEATAAGVFFTALEYNGHIYGLVLNNDSTAQVIADIDPGIGGAMALDYDAYEEILWVGTDNGYGNVSAQIVFNQTETPSITLINPPEGMDITRNNEGFAIADPEYTVNGLRPVFHFMDGMNTGVLTISYLHCDYQLPSDPEHVHTEVIIQGKLPTCIESGLTDGVKCSECGEWIVLQTEIPALGHQDKNHDGKCDVCSENLTAQGTVQTGDTSNPMIWPLLCVFSFTAAAGCIKKKHKCSKKEKKI